MEFSFTPVLPATWTPTWLVWLFHFWHSGRVTCRFGGNDTITARLPSTGMCTTIRVLVDWSPVADAPGRLVVPTSRKFESPYCFWPCTIADDVSSSAATSWIGEEVTFVAARQPK